MLLLLGVRRKKKCGFITDADGLPAAGSGERPAQCCSHHDGSGDSRHLGSEDGGWTVYSIRLYYSDGLFGIDDLMRRPELGEMNAFVAVRSGAALSRLLSSWESPARA